MEAFRLLLHRFSPTPKIICALKKIHPSATIHLLLMLYFLCLNLHNPILLLLGL